MSYNSTERGNCGSVPSSAGQRDVEKQQSVADPRLDDHDPINLTVSKTKSFSVRVKTPTQALMFIRFLLAKVVNRRDLKVLSVAEQVLLNESWEILRRQRSISFWKNKMEIISNFQYIQNQVRGTTLNPQWDHHNWWNSLAQMKGFPSMCAYFGWWKTFKIKNWFRFKNRELETKSPPKRFIGVGYRDQGNARDVAFDGSPSWQEVAGAQFLSFERNEPLGSIPYIP